VPPCRARNLFWSFPRSPDLGSIIPRSALVCRRAIILDPSESGIIAAPYDVFLRRDVLECPVKPRKANVHVGLAKMDGSHIASQRGDLVRGMSAVPRWHASLLFLTLPGLKQQGNGETVKIPNMNP
jgi:hypothetical protein